MTNVILVYPRFHERETIVLPPLSLLHIATPLVGRYRIVIVDQRVDTQWRQTLEMELAAGECLCVAISSMTGPQILSALEAAKLTRAKVPAVPIVWGGVHASLCPSETLRHELVDIVVVGDGEETFPELVDALQDGRDLAGVPGILFKRNGQEIRSPGRPPYDLSKMPEPAFSLIQLDRYPMPEIVSFGRYLPLVTSRGCPFHCGFCYNARFHHRRWSALPAPQTVALIRSLQQRFKLDGIFLLDDNFFVDLLRVEAICRQIKQEGLSLTVHNANCRADTVARMTDELLALLRNCGFNRLLLGVESGSDRILKHIQKGITVEQVLTANRRLRAAGIVPCYSFMAGFPGETVDDLKQTLSLMDRLIRENPSASVFPLFFYTPSPGTDLSDEAKAMGLDFPLSLSEWTGFDYDHLTFPAANGAHASFLQDAHFYSRYLDPKWAAAARPWKRPVLRLYSRMLRARVKNGWYDSRLELWPLRHWHQFSRREPQNGRLPSAQQGIASDEPQGSGPAMSNLASASKSR